VKGDKQRRSRPEHEQQREGGLRGVHGFLSSSSNNAGRTAANPANRKPVIVVVFSFAAQRDFIGI
jgi:hypothetical protein